MKKIIDIASRKQTRKGTNNAPKAVLRSTENSNITMDVMILTEDIKNLMLLIFDEIEDVREKYDRAVQTKNNTDMKYWSDVKKTFHELIEKLGKTQDINGVRNLTKIEMDCLLGCLEERIQDAQLNELMLIQDPNPELTQKLNELYHRLLPIFEEGNAVELESPKSKIIDIESKHKTD